MGVSPNRTVRFCYAFFVDKPDRKTKMVSFGIDLGGETYTLEINESYNGDDFVGIISDILCPCICIKKS
jgi:hypothetical protein